MKTFFSFIKKECMETIRAGRLTILLFIFLLFGIMNPAMAKITPWVMKMMESSLADSGLVVTEAHIDAMTSWTQFYKNIDMAFIVFILFVSNVFTKEYQNGTLVMVLTKGLSRVKVVLAKTSVMLLLWTICYWLCYGVTYIYNDYFWDNEIASHLLFAAFCYWLFGVWILSLMVLFSTIAQNNAIVLAGTGGVFILCNLLSMFSNLQEYIPLNLRNGLSILLGQSAVGDYYITIVVAVLSAIVLGAGSVLVFNRKMI